MPATPWFGATPTINNAFYDPTSNSINIMPGFVTSLLYTDDMSDADISNVWAEVMTEPMLQQQTLDVHPLSNQRVNVCAQMLDAMYDKLGVVEGDGMYLAPDERIVIWGPNA